MKRNGIGKTLPLLAVLTALLCVTLAGGGLAKEIEETEGKPEADNEYTYMRVVEIPPSNMSVMTIP